jgi:uncharacterized protein with PIN domain
MTRYVLDACALIAVLKGENDADAVGVATAIECGGVFVTADHHELETVANKETLNFFWFL